MNYSKLFLYSFLAALSIGSFYSIVILLFGSFGNEEFKIILSTFILGFYSLLSLASLAVYKNENIRMISILGIFFSVIALVIAELLIFDFFNLDLIHLFTISSILSIAFAHISVVFLITIKSTIMRIIRSIVIFCILVISILLIFTVVIGDSFAIQILGALSILSVLGTISLVILSKITLPDAK